MDILELGYNHLPLHLKKCFVYIGGFSEDYEIPVRKLIWLWVAKGFIQQCEEGQCLEAIAKDYLIGLVDRSLVTVARRSYLGEIKAIRVHDLWCILCLKKAKENEFFVRIKAIRVHDLWRILCSKKAKENEFFVRIYKEGASISPFEVDLWSMLCFDSPEFIRRVIPFHLMRLFFDWFRFDWRIIMSALCSLCCCCCYVPCCCFLPCMGIDDAVYNIKLPHNIFKMVELRHLYSKKGVFKYHLSHISSKIAARNPTKLNTLQTLHPICLCKDCQSFLVKTPNLKKLGFYGMLLSQDGALMFPDLEFLKCLETLSFINSRFIYKRIESSSLPAWLKLPPTITRLTFTNTFLKWEELSILQTLPSLEVLKLLMSACEGQVWNANELEGFFQLKYLRFRNLNIVEWNATEDQFPRLEVLVIENCNSLKRIPIDFANLNKLREIKLKWCTHSAEVSARKIQEEQGNRKGDDDCLHLSTR